MCALPLTGMEGAPINSSPADLSSSSGDQHDRAEEESNQTRAASKWIFIITGRTSYTKT